MHEFDISADELSARLLNLSATERVCILDSCGASHLGSHLMIAGIGPAEMIEFSSDDVNETLGLLEEHLSGGRATIFTISYDFGIKLQRQKKRDKQLKSPVEPDVFITAFDCLIVHDYDTHKTYIVGDEPKFEEVERTLLGVSIAEPNLTCAPLDVTSNFTRQQYLDAIDAIKELIRSGDTYQTNLTQQFEVKANQTSQDIFVNLRKDHPAPFAAFIQRGNSTVISASPERFFAIDGNIIRTSPIKGTRPRGKTTSEDETLKKELLESRKDIAENTMIVDLLRNDVGRVCEFGSVVVEKLCELEEHPTLLHLVSIVTGKLRQNTKFSDVLRAIFPCGSITGAPKHRTMQIIDRIETVDRGLSMGAIGISVPASHVPGRDDRDALRRLLGFDIQMSVAIRTMVVRDDVASFNVGGGIVIDSDPEKEYEESLLKAKALLNALGVTDGNSTTASGI